MGLGVREIYWIIFIGETTLILNLKLVPSHPVVLGQWAFSSTPFDSLKVFIIPPLRLVRLLLMLFTALLIVTGCVALWVHLNWYLGNGVVYFIVSVKVLIDVDVQILLLLLQRRLHLFTLYAPKVRIKLFLRDVRLVNRFLPLLLNLLIYTAVIDALHIHQPVKMLWKAVVVRRSIKDAVTLNTQQPFMLSCRVCEQMVISFVYWVYYLVRFDVQRWW